MDNPTRDVALTEYELDRLLRCVDYYLNVSHDNDVGGRYASLYERLDKVRSDLKAKPRLNNPEVRRMDVLKAKTRRK